MAHPKIRGLENRGCPTLFAFVAKRVGWCRSRIVIGIQRCDLKEFLIRLLAKKSTAPVVTSDLAPHN